MMVGAMSTVTVGKQRWNREGGKHKQLRLQYSSFLLTHLIAVPSLKAVGTHTEVVANTVNTVAILTGSLHVRGCGNDTLIAGYRQIKYVAITHSQYVLH